MDGLLSEEGLARGVEFFAHIVEAAGALVIFAGAVIAFVRFCAVAVRHHDPSRFLTLRLALGRYLALGLEFQLAADVLGTAIAPTLEHIGKLAAIAAIRTALNYFLSLELREERERVESVHP